MRPMHANSDAMDSKEFTMSDTLITIILRYEESANDRQVHFI